MSASHEQAASPVNESGADDSPHGHIPGEWYGDDDDDDEDEDESEDRDYVDDDNDEEEDDEEADGADDDEDGDAIDEAERSIQNSILRIITGGGSGVLNRTQIIALLRSHDLGQIIFDDDESPPPADPNRFPKVPSDEGRQLMESGLFGALDTRDHDRKRIARRILDRELGVGDNAWRKTNKELMAQEMIPSSRPEMIIHYPQPVCCGQFSDDGNFFYAGVKDFKVRMYDTSQPYSWKHYKTVRVPLGQWNLTDANLSPDNRWLACSSLESTVAIAPTDPRDTGDPYVLDLADSSRPINFAIFSLRFSGDGRNIIAGTGVNSIVVYDIERRQSLYHVRAHERDVNAVCFADKNSPHILYSGSDDATIKVWDTRSLGDGREAGAFVGHIEGLTYIDSKGDGRYVLSNGKDQTMKLWDLRMVMSTARFEELNPLRVVSRQLHDYDYRWQKYDENWWFKHPNDNSLVTFRGHQVQRTLIRCHFSPEGSTNSRYIYTGSYDGFVYVYNMDATLAAKINVGAAAESTRPAPRPRPRRHARMQWWGGGEDAEQSVTLVRDVGWHPNAPLLVASAWNGEGMGTAGTATVHSYNENEDDDAKPAMGISVDEKLVEGVPEPEDWQ